eukprot:5269246-Pyramimonas_sp.AAC.1
MKTPDGTEETHRQSIADVFATFYEELYKNPHHSDSFRETTMTTQHDSTIPPFTATELQQAITHFKND